MNTIFDLNIKNKIDDPKFQKQVKLIANKTMNTVGNVSSDIYNKAIEQKMAYEISNICKISEVTINKCMKKLEASNHLFIELNI